MYFILNEGFDIYLIRFVDVFSVHVPRAVHWTFKTIFAYKCDTVVVDLLVNGCCYYGYIIGFSTQFPNEAGCLS